MSTEQITDKLLGREPLTRSGLVGRYGFDCGCVQITSRGPERISLYKEHGCWKVAGRVRENWVLESFRKLTEARKRFRYWEKLL